MRGFRTEPVAVERAVRILIYAAIIFKLVAWDDMQVEAAVMVVVVVVFPLVEFLGGLFLRSQVTSEKTANRADTSRKELREVADHRDRVRMAVVSDGRVLQGWEREQ